MKSLPRVLFLLAAALLLLVGGVQAWRSSCRLERLSVLAAPSAADTPGQSEATPRVKPR